MGTQIIMNVSKLLVASHSSDGSYDKIVLYVCSMVTVIAILLFIYKWKTKKNLKAILDIQKEIKELRNKQEEQYKEFCTSQFLSCAELQKRKLNFLELCTKKDDKREGFEHVAVKNYLAYIDKLLEESKK